MKVAEMESFGVQFGRLVRDKRGVEGMSQDDLAERCGLNKSRVSDIETGKIQNPQTKTVDALCVALDISRDERESCYQSATKLPPRLLENLALRFGYNNLSATEEELENFLKEKSQEFNTMRERISKLNAAKTGIEDYLALANVALEEGDFVLADAKFAEAEHIQLKLEAIPALEAMCEVRLTRGFAALLSGNIISAAEHWEQSANFFRHIDRKFEADKRYNYCTQLRAYGYRYRSIEALGLAKNALNKNYEIWTKDKQLSSWCKLTNALGAVCSRISNFDKSDNALLHINEAKSFFEKVLSACTSMSHPYYYAAASINLGQIYNERVFASNEVEYYSNVERCIEILTKCLEILSQEKEPTDWGILRHNLGCAYITFFAVQANKHESIHIIDKAVYYLEQSFLVRDSQNSLQYWIASSRSLGEALIDRSLYVPEHQSARDLDRARQLLFTAVKEITELEHPTQWADMQNQIERLGVII